MTGRDLGSGFVYESITVIIFSSWTLIPWSFAAHCLQNQKPTVHFHEQDNFV